MEQDKSPEKNVADAMKVVGDLHRLRDALTHLSTLLKDLRAIHDIQMNGETCIETEEVLKHIKRKTLE